MKRIGDLLLCLSAFLIISSITGGLFLVHSDTYVQAQSPQSNSNGQITAPLDVADSIYSSNTTEFLGSKNISLTPYRMTEEHSSDQGFLKGVGNVTNNQTYISGEEVVGAEIGGGDAGRNQGQCDKGPLHATNLGGECGGD